MGQTKHPKAHTIELIRTELEVRGSGTDSDPYRTVEQFWTSKGDLVCEKDPFHPNATACARIVDALNDRGLTGSADHTRLAEDVETALDSLQSVIDKQKETISKLQGKIQEWQAEKHSEGEPPSETST